MTVKYRAGGRGVARMLFSWGLLKLDTQRTWAVRVDAVIMGPMTYELPSERDLMTGSEIAAELGWVDVGTAMSLVRKGTFPPPLVDKPGARLWLRAEVEHWARTAARRPGRRAVKDIEQ